MEERERWTADRGKTERRVKTGRGSRVMDGWCVFASEGRGARRERGVCEGAIKAVYYKSVTERVCGDNGGMSLSILPLSG